MSGHLDGESAAALAERRTFSWRTAFQWPAFAHGVLGTLRLWARRWREREEFLHYLAMDHRAGADLGSGATSAREWAERPFWRE